MLEAIMKYGVAFYVMGAAVAIGIVAKLISYVTIRKVVRAAGEIQKSNHRLMRLMKAKFEHASMVSDKVQNVEVFVKKYLYEYRVWGCRIDVWKSLPRKMVWLTLVIGFAGASAHYVAEDMGEGVFRMATTACGLAIFLWSISVFSDEQETLEAAKNYIVDYLENVCIHRYEKANKAEQVQRSEDTLETKIVEKEVTDLAKSIDFVPAEEAISEPDVSMVQKKVELAQEEADKARQEQERRIRAILQEFLA